MTSHRCIIVLILLLLSLLAAAALTAHSSICSEAMMLNAPSVPGGAAQGQQLSFSFDDPIGDQTGRIDVTRMVLAFDSTTGAYSITLTATPANPFVGKFRVNINLLNPDTNDNDAFFNDNQRDFDIAAATSTLTYTRTSSKLVSWRAGNRVATNDLPFGTPPGLPNGAFRSEVLNIPFLPRLADEIAYGPGGFTTIGSGPGGGVADLAITNTDSPDPVATGARLTYTIRVSNAGPGAAADVAVNDVLPNGSTLASVTSSQGSVAAPPVGAGGVITATLGAIGAGGSATITIAVNVLAVPGSTLANTATVSSPTSDPAPSNNSATATTTIQGGGVVLLTWEQPAPTPANPTPAPINLRVQPGGAASTSLVSSDATISPADTPCTLIQVNIYKADAQPVATIPNNLWKSVPPNQLDTTMAAAPSGSFYVITNVWKCGDMTVESGGSNEASVPAGPTIDRLKVGGKIKTIGSGFTDPAQVFLDGIGFTRPAVFGDSTVVIQKGTLTDGRSILDVVTPGKTVVISVRNSNGGISSLAFTAQ